jgi:transmembrane sensor
MQPDYTTYKAEDFLLDESFGRYCAGDPAEVKAWKNFLQLHPQMAVEVSLAQKLYNGLSIKASTEEKQLALQDLKARIAAENTGIVRSMNSGKWKKILAVAAVLTAVIIAVAVLYTSSRNAFNTDTPVKVFAQASYGEEIHAADDQRKKVTLADGSEVTLNYGSSIRISAEYNQKERWIYLDGEAFFEVHPDKQKPFVVITKDNATTALGTSFKVRNYTGEKESDVMLATGKVKVQSMSGKENNKHVILLPGERAAAIGDAALSRSTFNMSVLQNWQTLKIELNQADLEQIITSLEFNYGIQVKLQNKPSRAIAFTGKFSKESLHDVLEAIAYTNKFSYTQRGNIVSILFQ